MKYLLIDGNNLACRCAFANTDLKNKDGVSTGVHYGFMNSLVSLRQKFNEYQMLIVWDGKSKRRVAEANEGVKLNIVPEGYKENRKKDPLPEPLKNFYEQAPFLQRAIGAIGIPQIRLDEYEADDVIASYVKILVANNHEVITVTSDGDFAQLLQFDIPLWDGKKQKMTYRKDWEAETGLVPLQYIDVGALMGDTGDNIFGVPGWGEKTSIKEVKKYGTWQKVLEAYKLKYADSRKAFPDLKDPLLIKDGYDPKKVFEELSTKKNDPVKENSRLSYPDITFEMPYTGVLNAFDKDLLKIKASKTEIMALMFEDRIRLAYSLKKMDYIDSLPEINRTVFNKEKVLEYFRYYDITTLDESVYLFE